ncbi:MAG TPA: STM3941 family protein, partial [Burkholderiales bacterium]
IAIPFSVILGALVFPRLCSRKPALIIDEKGITDNASGMSVGFVPWDDITGTGIAVFRKRRFLGISVRNPEEYLAKAGRLKRMLMKANQRALGCVINIPQATLPVSIENILAHINGYRQSSLP